MKLKFIIICVLIFVFFACKKTTKAESEQKETTPIAKKLCYLTLSDDYTIGNYVTRDSIVLNIEIDNDRATGIFNFIPAEIDSRRGSFEGSFKNDTIRAIYTYSAEGDTYEKKLRIVLSTNLANITSALGETYEQTIQLPKIDCGNKEFLKTAEILLFRFRNKFGMTFSAETP